MRSRVKYQQAKKSTDFYVGLNRQTESTGLRSNALYKIKIIIDAIINIRTKLIEWVKTDNIFYRTNNIKTK